MKKILLGICSLAFVSCLSAGIALNNSVEVANAETSVFTETKCQISNEGDKMLVVTGITDVSVIYEVGYYVNGKEYVAVEGETAETNKYYESLTLGSATTTAAEFIDGAAGLLIWEINYDSANAYSVQPYALVGTKVGDALIAPDDETPIEGTKKENFNVLTVTLVDEEGTEIDKVNVNYGATISENAITAPEKENYTFKGWYVDGEEYNFDTKVTSNLTLTAKYQAPAKYTVQVLAAQYTMDASTEETERYKVNESTLNYVNVTSEYASVFGLDEKGQSQGEVDSFVDLTEKINTLKGAKLNETASNVSGTIEEGDSLTLTVCLDFDETELGFDVKDLRRAWWEAAPTLTLKYMYGECGLAIDVATTISNGRQLFINFDEITLADYASISFRYYEKSTITGANLTINNKQISLISQTATKPTDYVSATVDLVQTFSDQTSISQILLTTLGASDKNIFIPAIEKRTYMKETVTYSVDNGNIMNIATPLNGVELTTKSYNFETFSDEKDALYYNYSGEEIVGDHKLGIIFDINVNVSDYNSIKIVYRAFNANGNATSFWMNGNNYVGYAGGYFQTIDLIKLAKDNGITTISTFELQVSASKVSMTTAELYIAHIEFVLN